jgi:hypothetical protein
MSTITSHENTRFRAPIWTLLILAPFIAEVLSGSTRLSIIFVFIPEVMVWGVGALLCRELVRRWRAGGASLLLLGLALSVAEEFIIQQTSIAPLPFPGADIGLDRVWGVNWLYFLFMLGFESVWVVLIPVQVTELFFPQQRNQPWLRKRGLIGCCVAFVVGSYLAWFGWTQQARTKKLHAAPYHPPLVLLACGLAAIALLVLAAYSLRGYGHSARIASRRAPHPWVAGVAAFLFCSAWWSLITLEFSPQPRIPHWLPLAAGVTWAVLAFAIFNHWSAAGNWGDKHRLMVTLCTVAGTILVAYLNVAGYTRLDLIGKCVFDAIAIAGFALLARKVWLRESLSEPPTILSRMA